MYKFVEIKKTLYGNWKETTLADKISVIVTTITTVVAFISLYFVYRTYGSDGEHMRGNQRPWITATAGNLAALTVGKPISYALHIENSGNTPAQAESLTGTAVFVIREIGQSDSGLETMASIKVLSHVKDLPIPSPLPVGPPHVTGIGEISFSNKPVTAEILKAFQDGNQRVYSIGTITYKDLFGGSYETQFCYVIQRSDRDENGIYPIVIHGCALWAKFT